MLGLQQPGSGNLPQASRLHLLVLCWLQELRVMIDPILRHEKLTCFGGFEQTQNRKSKPGFPAVQEQYVTALCLYFICERNHDRLIMAFLDDKIG